MLTTLRSPASVDRSSSLLATKGAECYHHYTYQQLWLQLQDAVGRRQGPFDPVPPARWSRPDNTRTAAVIISCFRFRTSLFCLPASPSLQSHGQCDRSRVQRGQKMCEIRAGKRFFPEDGINRCVPFCLFGLAQQSFAYVGFRERDFTRAMLACTIMVLPSALLAFTLKPGNVPPWPRSSPGDPRNLIGGYKLKSPRDIYSESKKKGLCYY
jgi:hypothetical protein